MSYARLMPHLSGLCRNIVAPTIALDESNPFTLMLEQTSLQKRAFELLDI